MEQKMKKTNAICLDIDGTLAIRKEADRSPYDWDNVDLDKPNPPVVEIIRKFKKDYMIILLSGRDEVARERTEYWLFWHHIKYDHLFMRPKGDQRQDCIVKKELYDKYVEPKYDVLFVVDDRPNVIKMWKNESLFVLDVYQDPERTEF